MTVPASAALFTDLYELTMADSYVRHGLVHQASFDLFVRTLPAGRAFLVACGVDEAVDYLAALRFEGADLEWLAARVRFSDVFLEYLATVRFDGEVWAVREGEVVFQNEPLLSVTAPLPIAQIAETYLINCVSLPTMVASKAARVDIACAGRPFVEFGARRVHGVDAALRGARAAVVGGASGTSLVAAGAAFGIELSGTMAHSYVMSFPDELTAFGTYARDHPESAVLLIDTYDTVAGARHAATVAKTLAREGIQVTGVRLDSGDLAALSRQVRAIFDEEGLRDMKILASGDLDEDVIAGLVEAGAPIDSFGVGTRLGTSADHPTLGTVYKLVEDANGPKMKLSPDKVTLPGRKQVHRMADHDVLALRDEEVPGGQPLLEAVMVGGARVRPPQPLPEAQALRAAAVAGLPPRMRSLERPAPRYEVALSDGLERLVQASIGAAAHG